MPATTTLCKRSGKGRGFTASDGGLNNPGGIASLVYIQPGTIGDHAPLGDPVAGELRGGQHPRWRRWGTEPGKCPDKNDDHEPRSLRAQSQRDFRAGAGAVADSIFPEVVSRLRRFRSARTSAAPW